MFRTFYPKEYVDSTYVIDFDAFAKKGYKGRRALFEVLEVDELSPLEEPTEETALKILLAIPVLPRINEPLTLTIETRFKQLIPQMLDFFLLSKGP